MGVLGKDLFDLHRPQTNTKVEFGASAYWVEDRPQPQPYGTVLTEVLNLDVAPFQKLLDQLNTAVSGKSNDVLRAYMDMKKGLLCRSIGCIWRTFASSVICQLKNL